MGAGRPLKFETPEALQALVDKYFKTHAEDELTWTGLCLAIGTTKQCLEDYLKRDEYSEVVEMAKLRVENAYELSLRKNGNSGNIFALKNFGWKDKTEQDINASVGITKVESIIVDTED